MNKSIILLSAGLDSLVALGYTKNKYNIELALTFDYGQKSGDFEINNSKLICEYYNIKHKVIKLDWLSDITKTALVSDEKVPETNFGTIDSAKSVWVPNRNALFLNIAGCYSDAEGYNNIIFGANKDEANTFPDNTEEFRSDITRLFQTSTLTKPKVIAPLINYTKNDIVKIAIENNIPLDLVRSCYNSNKLHCGKCESCNHLKNALIENGGEKYVSILFE